MSRLKPIMTCQNQPHYQYIPVRETLYSRELGIYVTYGIRVCTASEEIAFVHDVSTDREIARRLAKKCTEHQLLPTHLRDLLEDLLADPEAVIG